MQRKKLGVAIVAGLSGAFSGLGSTAKATILTGPVVTIYSDNFAAPATNVNASSADPNAIVGNSPAVTSSTGGGTAGATYISTPVVTSTTGTPDTDWDYSGSNSATITSPAANVVTGEDTRTITNLALPLTPVVGGTYDFELTMNAPAGTGGHGLEMAFLFNGGNGHITSGQAISNNDPVGLILDRDATSTTGYFDIFQSTGTNGDSQFNPSSNSLSGGSPGTTLTVDEVLTPTGDGTAGNEVVYVNGIQAASFSYTGATGGISDIQFGDNRDAGGTFTSFSLTAQNVPEPASLAALALGGLLLRRRNRRPE